MLKHNTLAAEHHRQSLQTRQPPFITLEESGGGFDQVQQSLTLETLDRGLEKEQTLTTAPRDTAKQSCGRQTVSYSSCGQTEREFMWSEMIKIKRVWYM